MKYFRMNFNDATRAKYEVWNRQIEVEQDTTVFSDSVRGMDTSVWTEDADGEVLFRQVLNELGIKYQENDEQQIVTWLDRL
jgi:hypothetical protein